MELQESIEIKNLLKSGISTIKMHRINFGNRRMYCEIEPFRVFSGLTGALGAATFKGDFGAKMLVKWRDKMIDHLGSQKVQEAYLNTLADFGTLCHECIVRIKENGGLNWKYEQDYATEFFINSAKANGIAPNLEVVRAQVHEYCKSAASILQFFYDYVIDVYSIEGMAKSDLLQIATPIDVTCRIKDKKGEINVTLNLKTSEQINEHQLEQSAVEKYLWNESYPDLQVQKTGILRPKNWLIKKGIPTYELELLEEQDEYNLFHNAFDRLQLVRNSQSSTYTNFPNEVLTFVGETKLGEKPNLEIKTLEQVFMANYSTEVK